GDSPSAGFKQMLGPVLLFREEHTMLHSTSNLFGRTLLAEDGEIGKVDEMYFDTNTWTVRYLVVRTGNWLNGRRVLLSPSVVRRIDPEGNQVVVGLSREQVRQSP